MVQIHRFHDKVAIYIGTGETVYLTPEAAKEIGGALIDCAKDIDTCKFTKSTFSTVEVEVK